MRLGLFAYRPDGTFLRVRDWARSGIEFIKHRAGRASGQMYCVVPAMGTFAEMDSRADLKLVNGARAWMTDRGAWGSGWIVANGAWFPEGTIRHNATPEGAIAAPVGSDAVDVVTGTRYRKNTGTGNTGWASY